MFNRYAWLACAIASFSALVLAEPAHAGTFDVSISPPRIEQRAKPGKIARNSLAITNFASEPGRYLVKTADWGLTEEGRVTFNEGAPDERSCRPWVRIERRQLTVPAGATKGYRFEVHVPAGVEAGGVLRARAARRSRRKGAEGALPVRLQTAAHLRDDGVDAGHGAIAGRGGEPGGGHRSTAGPAEIGRAHV